MVGWILVISSCRIQHHVSTQQLLPQDTSIGLHGSHIATQQTVLGPDQTGCSKFRRTCQQLCRNPPDSDIPLKMLRSRQVFSQPHEEPGAKSEAKIINPSGNRFFFPPAFVLYFPSLKKTALVTVMTFPKEAMFAVCCESNNGHTVYSR